MQFEEIKTITVLGTGNMGPGIALQFAKAGYQVFTWGRNQLSVEKGVANFKRNIDDLIRESIISDDEAERIYKNNTITNNLDEAVSTTDFIVEAIAENLEVKQDIFTKLEALTSERTIYASSTSTLLPTPLSEKIRLKERFLVAHFWNPAYLAPLVEVCGSPHTSVETTEATMKLLSFIGNEPVLMKKEILGFIGNRIMHAMNREALHLIGTGVVTPEEVDKAILGSFGPRFANLGPMEYLDFSGLDLIKAIQGYLYADLDNTPGVLPAVEERVNKRELGAKSGKGLFDWKHKNTGEIRKKRDQEFIRKMKDKN